MLRTLVASALRTAATRTTTNGVLSHYCQFANTQYASFATLNCNQWNLIPKPTFSDLASPAKPSTLLQIGGVLTPQPPIVRTVTKFSLIKGKRKSVKGVIKRFKRLNWGIWIRTHSGRQKKLFKKSAALKRRLRQHVFTNATQSFLLDKMVTSFWRRPKYYIDDPYEPYHSRDEYFTTKGKTFKV